MTGRHIRGYDSGFAGDNILGYYTGLMLLRVSICSLAAIVGLSSCHRNDGTTLSANAASSNSSDKELFPVTKDGKWGYINRVGKVVIQPQFDGGEEFAEGLANVCVGPCKFVKDNPNEPISFEQTWQGKHGFIDANGKMVINPRYSVAGNFHRGLALASTREFKLSGAKMQYGYINKQGDFVIPEQFHDGQDFGDNGLAGVCVGEGGDRCGFIDTTGKFVINPQFYSVSPFSKGLSTVSQTKNSNTSYINEKGEIIWKGDGNAPEPGK